MAQFIVEIPDKIVTEFELKQTELFLDLIKRVIAHDLRLNADIDSIEPQGRYHPDFKVREIRRV